ncbi:MAG: hypothetical protein MJE77_25985 [Proteobacteria bacterium]|nr:hypothetical protein [Pseudomonadota bacterium]
MRPGGNDDSQRSAIVPYRLPTHLLKDRAQDGVCERIKHAADHDRLACDFQALNTTGTPESATSLILDRIQIRKRTVKSELGHVEPHGKGIIHNGARPSTSLSEDLASGVREGDRPPPKRCNLRGLGRPLFHGLCRTAIVPEG